nr:homing endonuclease [Klebsiella phage vB_Kpn_K7PH164C4]
MYFVYIFANEDQRLIPRRTKVGYSRDPFYRLNSLQLHRLPHRGLQDIVIHSVYIIDDASEFSAKLLEKAAHKKFKPMRVNFGDKFDGHTEWFDVEPHVIEKFFLSVGAKQVPIDKLIAQEQKIRKSTKK